MEDENDNSPSFDRHIYQGSIRENSPPGTEVILGSVLKVQDPDINDIVRLRVRIIREPLFSYFFVILYASLYFYLISLFFNLATRKRQQSIPIGPI